MATRNQLRISMAIAPRAAGLLCAVAVLATACAPPAGSRARSPKPSTPLLTDFNRFCLETRAERDVALDDARRAKLDIIDLPAEPGRPATRAVGWVHATRDSSVLTMFLGEEKAPDGSARAVFCQSMGGNDHGRSLKAIDAWLGPGHPLRSGSGHEFQLKRGRAWPLAETDKKAVGAARAAGNYYFLMALDRKGMTTLSLRRWRSATPGGPQDIVPAPQSIPIPSAPKASASGSSPAP